MKTFKLYTCLLTISLTSLFYAQDSNQDAIIQEVAKKGKADLIRILSSDGKNFNFGVTAKDLEGTDVGNPIIENTIDFKSLLSNTIKRIDDTQYVVPFIKNRTAVTTVTVSSSDNKFKVTELINQQYSTELNELSDVIKRNRFKNLEILVVQNLNAVIYVVGDLCYTNYNGRNIKEEVKVTELFDTLFIEAKDFQTKYGEDLKKNKLVR